MRSSWRGTFTRRNSPPSKFDVVICLETISHVPDQAGFIERLATVTRPGGYLIITAQNKFVYERRSDIGPPKPGSIRKWLTDKQLRELLAASLPRSPDDDGAPQRRQRDSQVGAFAKVQRFLESPFRGLASSAPRNAWAWAIPGWSSLSGRTMIGLQPMVCDCPNAEG